MTELYWEFCTENIIRVRDTKLGYIAEHPRRYFLKGKSIKNWMRNFVGLEIDISFWSFPKTPTN